MPHTFVADVDDLLTEKFPASLQCQRKANLHHHRRSDVLWQGFEVAKQGSVMCRVLNAKTSGLIQVSFPYPPR